MKLIDWDKVVEWMHRQNQTTEQWSMLIAIENFVDDMPTIEVEPRWVPIKYRPMDEEEKQYWSEYMGVDDEMEMFDCPMPEDGQEILVTFKSGYVNMDVCEIDGGLYGLEGNGDWDGIIAWMPLPEPYRKDGEKDNE